MMARMRLQNLVAGCLTVLFLLAGILCSPLMAEQFPEGEKIVVLTKKFQADIPPSAGPEVPTILRADRGETVIGSGFRFNIVPGTVVFRGDQEIPLSALPIPSKVKIEYVQLPNGGMNVKEITVISVLSGATTAWSIASPD
jgi:hypothetical protein